MVFFFASLGLKSLPSNGIFFKLRLCSFKDILCVLVPRGFTDLNNSELFELMRMKRSHGFIREAYSETAQKYKDSYPNIMPSFLFATDGYNFRNTELAAFLGISQLKKLDSIIRKRNKNLEKN